MTGEILNPVRWEDIEPDMTEAEKQFAECLAQGNPCVFEDAVPKVQDLRNAAPKAQEPKGRNTIRSEVIRFFAFGGDEKNRVLGPIIQLHGAWIDGDIHLAYASIRFGLEFRCCHIDGNIYALGMECRQLNLNGSCLTGEFTGDGMRILGNLHMRQFTAHGPVSLLGAHISRSLDMSSSRFCNQQGRAIIADDAKIDGTVFLQDIFAAGDVRLISAQIGGHLYCSKSRFHATQQAALVADGMHVGGNVELNDHFSAIGSVRLVGASIGGDLNCANAKIIAKQVNSICADRITIGGHVFLDKGFWSIGTVRFVSAQIGGDFACVKGRFNVGMKFRESLILDKANVKGALHWQNLHPKSDGIVTFAFARVSAIMDSLESWKPFAWRLNGFVYDAFAGDETPTDASSRLVWLGNHPDGMKFSPQPHEQAAKILFRMGHTRDARKILLEKERRQTEDGEMYWLRKAVRQLWDVFAGYGYRLRYTMAWMLGIVVFGAAFFGVAVHCGEIVPHDPAILASEKYQKALGEKNIPIEAVRAAFPDEYPEFTPLAFSLDVFIPFFALHQEQFWGPASNKDDDWWKSSILLVLFLAVSMAFAWLTLRFQDWIRRTQGGVSGLTGAGIGMALLVSLLGFNFVAGVALVCLDFEIGLWLVDGRWLTLWYWFEIAMGWILTSAFSTGLLRLRQLFDE